ncbi:hypothetical protein Tco_1538123 [Tanacetum coccineum]
MAGALPSDTIKNPKLNVNSTSPVLSARSYLTIDPYQLQAWMRIGKQQTKEPEPTLEDEFQDLHLNLPVLEFLTHALIYNAMLDKYVESLELGKNTPAFVQGKVPAKIEDLRLGSFSKKTKRKFCSEAGDGIRIYPDGVVILDEKKLGSS